MNERTTEMTTVAIDLAKHVFQVAGENAAGVDELVELYHHEGKPLPPPTAGRDLANSLQQIAQRLR